MSSSDFLPRVQAEEIRYQQREWKAGYAVGLRHRRWTTIGVALVVFLALRRWKVPVAAIVAWGVAFVLAFWWLILALVIVEVRRRRRVQRALLCTFSDDPFPG